MSRILVIEGNVPVMHALAEAIASSGAITTTMPADAAIAGRFGFDTDATPDCVVVSIAAAKRTADVLAAAGQAGWAATADAPQLAMLQALVALRQALAGKIVTVVLIGAALGLTGAAHHVALATATEGQRGMMKSLARQWGPQIRFTWLAVSTPLLFPEIAEHDLPEQCELGDYVPSLQSRPTVNDVAQLVLMLGSGTSIGITGQTLVVDGGEWMLP